ncbi:MAG: polyketide synthase dehydratase domain-containing protein, partial [Pseudomonadota bacterium]
KYLRPETLQFFGFYTSVAGRYGNKGQTDYGAANEVLNQLAYLLHKEWDGQVKVCGINWGPWLRVTHGSGMVTPETKAQFEARGVSLILPDEGRDFVLNEVLHGHTDDIEVIAGDNPWEYEEAQHAAFHGDEQGGFSAASQPLLHRAKRKPGSSDSYDLIKQLDLVTDPYADHHRIDGKPVVPFTFACELMAEAALSGSPGKSVAALTDVSLFKGIVLDQDKLDLEARVKPVNGHADVELWTVEETPKPAYRSRVIFDGVPDARIVPLSNATAENGPSIQSAYRDWLFHGPDLQTVRSILHLDETHITALGEASDPGHLYPPAKGAAWIFDPAILDGALQLVLVWSRAMRNETGLPARLGRMVRTGTEPLVGPVRIEMHYLSAASESRIRCDFTIYDAENRPRIIVQDFEATSTSRLNRVGGRVPGLRPQLRTEC